MAHIETLLKEQAAETEFLEKIISATLDGKFRWIHSGERDGYAYSAMHKELSMTIKLTDSPTMAVRGLYNFTIVKNSKIADLVGVIEKHIGEVKTTLVEGAINLIP